MKSTHLITILVGLAAIGIFAPDASAMYHAPLGRWVQRDPASYSGRMSLYEYAGSQPSRALDPSGETIQSRIDAKKCQITIVLNVTIYPVDEEAKWAFNWDKLAQRIRDSVLREWDNEGQGRGVDCCKVRFEVNVTQDLEHTSWRRVSGDNRIAINDIPAREFDSHVHKSYRGEWSNREEDWVYAHEAGHLMKLPDDYHDTRTFLEWLSGKERATAPNSGHEGHMMAEYSGKVAEHEVRDVLKNNNLECPCKPPPPPQRLRAEQERWMTR